MRNRRSQRGFTLIELLISLAVMGFSISLAMGIFVAQQKSFQSLDLQRIAQEAGRDASLDFETSLRRVGFGLDPQVALDFNSYACTGTSCRDKTTGPDEIVFYARNPNYYWDPAVCSITIDPLTSSTNGCFMKGKGWSVASSGGSSILINARVGETFTLWPGQLIEVTQPGGSKPLIAWVTSKVTATGTAGTLSIPLTTTTGNPYQTSIPTSGYVAAFLVDRFRYYVDSTSQSDPYLMFDSGLNNDPNNPNNPERVPVAKNVEDLQIAYVLNTPTGSSPPAPDSNKNWIVGDVAGSQEQPDPNQQAPQPDYVTASATDSSRFTMNPSNVRMVRYSFTIRSYRPDPNPTASWTGDPFLFQENRDTTTGVPALGRYRRVVIKGTVALRNMESRSPFVF
jgi:prepilin-type N-terminal cleavage/methylation domain-containing protein